MGPLFYRLSNSMTYLLRGLVLSLLVATAVCNFDIYVTVPGQDDCTKMDENTCYECDSLGLPGSYMVNCTDDSVSDNGKTTCNSYNFLNKNCANNPSLTIVGMIQTDVYACGGSICAVWVTPGGEFLVDLVAGYCLPVIYHHRWSRTRFIPLHKEDWEKSQRVVHSQNIV